MDKIKSLHKKIEKLTRERDAYANSLTLSNTAFMQKVKEFSIIKRIADSISWSLDKQLICTEIVDLIIDETTAENCSLWLVDPDLKHIILVAARGQANNESRYFSEDSSQFRRMKLGKGAAGWVAIHGESLLIEDVTKSVHFVPGRTPGGMNIKSLLCLPIKGSKEVLGVLNLSHPDIGAFSKENERVLRLITDQTGVVLTNLHFFEEIQEFNKHLEQMVTDRTRNLKESEERYERAIVAGKVGVWDWKVGTWKLFLAPNLLAMLGYKSTKITNLKDWLKLTHHEDRKLFLKEIMAHIRGKTPVYEGEHRMYHKNGKTVWFFVRGAVVRDEHGRITGVSGSHTDITKRKLAEEELEKVQEAALVHARFVGRAEFATTVLHNIGNVLNSVNVNSMEIRNAVKKTGFKQLFLAFQMIKKNKNRLASFLSSDEKGKQLPDYFIKKAQVLEKDSQTLISLTEEINDKVALMRDIIETQQSFAKKRETTELRDPIQLVDESIKVQMQLIKREGVTIQKQYHTVPHLVLPPAKLIHVLINIIKNGIEAMAHIPPKKRTLFIKIREDGAHNTTIRIKDTGIGIEAKAIPKMFTHGYTTKASGHGFGLHYCMQTIKEMGGDIRLASKGKGKGATFTLVFPAEMRNPHYRRPRKT